MPTTIAERIIRNILRTWTSNKIIHEQIPDNFLRRDVHIELARHLVFVKDIQVVFLTKTWYIDATFHVIWHPFYQLSLINAFVRQDRCTKCSAAYRWQYVNVSPQKDALCGGFPIIVIVPQRQVKRIVLDFEDATWNAVRIIFPTGQPKGRAFHFTQAIYRHIQEFGLQVANIKSLLHASTPSSQMFLDTVLDSYLVQVVHKPTRGDNMLDLILIRNEALVDNVNIEEPFVSSNHCVVRFDMTCNIGMKDCKLWLWL